MDPDDRTALLETLPAHNTKSLLSFLRPRERAQAQKLLEFPEDSVGRLMTPDFLAIRKEWTVSRSLDFIRFNGEDKETLNDIYVVDRQGKLLDDIPIREFLLSPGDRAIADVMDGHYTALLATAPQEEAIQAFKKYSARTALPVVDEDGLLLGIVTIDDILHLEEKETTEDIQKFGGAAPLEESYLEIPIWSLLRKRAGWLSILFVGEMFTASAMSFYEVEISKAVVLALFIPLIISSGGNSGSQAATLIIRAMALGEVTFADVWKVLQREMIVGVGLGIILGLLGLLRVTIWGVAFGAYGGHFLLIGTAVCTAVLCVVTWGALVGSMLPLVLKRLGLDPATSSAPFVATLIDVTGIVIYFNIALLVMSGRLF
jgi:magnesium transporter